VFALGVIVLHPWLFKHAPTKIGSDINYKIYFDNNKTPSIYLPSPKKIPKISNQNSTNRNKHFPNLENHRYT
jgi:hypothetical protein